MKDNFLQMYLNFRQTIDSYAFPLLREWDNVHFVPITDDGFSVGFLMVVGTSMEAIYVQPEYRRKGLARQAVIDFIKNKGKIYTLCIVNNNIPAKKFWESLFVLKVINSCSVDTLYHVEGYKFE